MACFGARLVCFCMYRLSRVCRWDICCGRSGVWFVGRSAMLRRNPGWAFSARTFSLPQSECCGMYFAIPPPPRGNRILSPPRISGPGRLLRLTVAGRGRIILGDNRSPASPAWCQTVRFNLNSPAGQMAAVTSSEPSQKSCLPKMTDDQMTKRHDWRGNADALRRLDNRLSGRRSGGRDNCCGFVLE